MKITSLLVLKCSGDSPFRLLPARRHQGVHPLRRPHRRQAHPARATPIGSARWYLPLKFDPFNPAASLSAVSSFSLSSFSSSPAPAMGGSRTQVNKPHKTRFASEASLHAHKISVSGRYKDSLLAGAPHGEDQTSGIVNPEQKEEGPNSNWSYYYHHLEPYYYLNCVVFVCHLQTLASQLRVGFALDGDFKGF